ncbi:BTAD domain-containing putative transcriptional regulator [Streptomyces olivoreticuli]|uniref:BTAD domain-containing putative transcriptional regulator n=1 Tax=Streptomyces olivoreticuli TaxID=68246 RepID=UPI001F077F1D|nr:BTAD domain-containing putative transcriptional regulator [Streptomyces olivoreticuli]
MPVPPAPSPTTTAASRTADRTGPLLRVLGPMSVHHDGRDLPLGPPRQRALLALLLIRLGRVVPTELLVEELWGERPPRQAVVSLQSHLSRLRRALHPAAAPGHPPVLRHRAPGYVLELDPEHIDFCRFERLVTDGRRLLERGDPLAAHDRLTAALTLWHGTPYAEFDNHPALYDESTRLEQVRLTALESRAEARLALGAAQEVATELEAEVRRHPARERLVGHLMTALSRLGRQAEALEVYERTRGHLVERFGVDTAAELRRIRTAILRREPEAGGPAGHPDGEPEQAGESGEHGGDDDAGAAGGRADHGPGTRGSGEAEVDREADGIQRSSGPGRATEDAEVTSAGATSERPAAPSPFTGRGRELRRLTTAAASALIGHGHVAGVLGPAGVGKTRLLLELAPRLEAAVTGRDGTGLEVVWGHCFPGEGVPPYWLWTQILRRLSATRPDDFRHAVEPFGTLLAPLLPERSAVPEGPGPASDRGRARFLRHDAVCEVLLALAGRSPLVLLLEDLHWADAASLELLGLLGIRRQGHPLGIVLTAREFEAESDPTLRRTLSEVLRGPRTETLRLGGLSRQAVAALVGAQAGPGVNPEVVDVLHRRSEGNPYFVTQLLSLFDDARGLHRPDAVDVLLTRVPAGVREVLHQRFAALPEPVLRVLRLCAVIGTEVDTDLLRRTAADDEPVAAALEAAIGAGLLDEDPHHPGRLHFAHALVRETLIDELAHEERHRMHAAVSEALCARRPLGVENEEIERVAHHTWHAQCVIPAARALPRLLRAAEHAERHWAYEEVETWLRRAVHLVGLLPSDDPSAVRLERQLHIQLGQVLATTRGHGHPEAESQLAHGRTLDAAAHAPEDPSALWALCAASLVTGRYDASRRFSGRLREIARRTGEPVALLGAAYGEGIVLHVRGQLPQALAKLEQGIETADRFALEGHSPARTFRHDPRVSCRSYAAFTHWLMGDRRTAGTRRRELLHLTGFESRPSDRCFALYADAVVAAWEGDAATARSSGSGGARLAGEHGLLYWKAMLGLLEGWGLAHSGRADDGLSLMHASLTGLRGCNAHIRHPLHLGLLGQAQHHAGRTEEARTTFRTLLAAVERHREHVYLHASLPATRLLHDLLGRGAAEAV